MDRTRRIAVTPRAAMRPPVSAMIVAVIAVILQAGAAATAAAETVSESFSHAALDTVLRAHLRDGRVDYGALARDPAPLRRYLAAAAVADPGGWPRDAQVAFWVNVYNARVLEGVIRRPGLRSVLDVGRFLGVPTLRFFRDKRPTAGEARSLDDIEHRILRARYGDPRLHFVLNCASTSCPELPERPLSAATLEADLARATTRFLADPTRNRITAGPTLEVSAIFKWYADDFRDAAGSVPAWIARHAPGAGTIDPQARVRHLDYDWSLNGSW